VWEEAALISRAILAQVSLPWSSFMLHFDGFPPHLQLLLLATGAPTGDETAREIERIATRNPDGTDGEPIDWEQFFLACERHRVTSLAWRTLGSSDVCVVPEPVRSSIQRRAMNNAVLALRSAIEIGRISQRFADDGVDLTVLKGVALSNRLYGSPNARNVGDVDLLSLYSDPGAQIERMVSLGYDLINPVARLTRRRAATYLRFWKDLTFRSAEAGTDLDLHWRLFNNRLHPANRLLEQATYATEDLFGVRMRVLAPEDQFLYVTAHGISDSFTYFKSLADVAGFLQLLTPAELDSALRKARSLGLLRQISAAIHMANDWMRAGAESALLLPEDEPLAVAIRNRTTKLLQEQDFLPDRDFASPASWLRLETRIIPGPRSLLEMAMRFVWRPRVWSSVDLPDNLFFLYPVLGLLLPPRIHSVEAAPAAGHNQAAPRTPLESPNSAGRIGVSKSPPKA
jgi:hypothetical protein